MLKVLKFKHITMFGRDLDEILVADNSIPSDMNPCELCIFKETQSSDCDIIHECATPIAGYNTYWLLGACTASPNGEANPNGRHVDV